jgi:hypothetical protein
MCEYRSLSMNGWFCGMYDISRSHGNDGLPHDPGLSWENNRANLLDDMPEQSVGNSKNDF